VADDCLLFCCLNIAGIVEKGIYYGRLSLAVEPIGQDGQVPTAHPVFGPNGQATLPALPLFAIPK